MYISYKLSADNGNVYHRFNAHPPCDFSPPTFLRYIPHLCVCGRSRCERWQRRQGQGIFGSGLWCEVTLAANTVHLDTVTRSCSSTRHSGIKTHDAGENGAKSCAPSVMNVASAVTTLPPPTPSSQSTLDISVTYSAVQWIACGTRSLIVLVPHLLQ